MSHPLAGITRDQSTWPRWLVELAAFRMWSSDGEVLTPAVADPWQFVCALDQLGLMIVDRQGWEEVVRLRGGK